MSLLDFKAANSLINIKVVLAEIHWRPFSQKGQQARGKCPLHQSGNPVSRSFAVNFDKNSWYCHRCKTGGDPFDLFAAVMGGSTYEAAVYLCQAHVGHVPFLKEQRRGTVNRGVKIG